MRGIYQGTGGGIMGWIWHRAWRRMIICFGPMDSHGVLGKGQGSGTGYMGNIKGIDLDWKEMMCSSGNNRPPIILTIRWRSLC